MSNFYNGNNEESKLSGSIMIVLVVVFLLGYYLASGGSYEGESAENWFNEYDAETAYSTLLEEALYEANYNIEECNEAIEDAKEAKDYDYYDEPTPEGHEAMKNALEDLGGCETIAPPQR